MKNFYFTLVFVGFSFFVSAQGLEGTPVQGLIPIQRVISNKGITENMSSMSNLATESVSTLAITPTGTSNEVGVTEGQLSVSLSGSATYAIPIMVPPGINGVVPQISLVYNSQGGNGIAGYGWNVSGVSKITRIASTKYHDGTADAVDFDNLDRFAFDGQRLVVKSGTTGVYGADGTVYETEGFSNVLITSYGTHSSGANYGPSYFKVEYPDGSIAFYGNSDNSRSKLEWAITYWKNPQNIAISYYYDTNPSLNITSIKYGTQNINTFLNEIQFVYDTKVITPQGYIGGQSISNSLLLKKINVFGNTIGFRNYELVHNPNSLGYERLASITEKNGDNTLSYNPTVFSYENTSESVSYADITTKLNIGNINSLNAGTVSGDFDGDEKMEFLMYPTTGTSSKTKYWLFKDIISDSSNMGYEHNVGAFETIFPVSYLSDNNKLMQKQGWVVAKKTDTNYTFTVYSTSISSSINTQYDRVVNFPTQSVGVSCTISCQSVTANKIFPKRILSGDFNGDGLTDVVAIDTELTNKTCISAKVCNSSQSTIITSKKVYFVDLKRDNTTNFLTYSGELLANITSSSKVEVADINGDGKSDVMVFENGKVTSYALNDANQLVLLWNYSDANIAIDSSKTILLGDYNGDGKTDFIIPKTYGSTEWYKYYSTGIGFIKVLQNYTGVTFLQNNGTNTYNYIASDYDKDGISDLILTKSTRNSANTSGSLAVTCYKNRNAIFSTAYAVTASSPYYSDINLNALPIYLPTGKGTQTSGKPYNPTLEIAFLSNDKIFYFNSDKDNTKDQLVRTITTGNGVTESITYKPLSSDSKNDNGQSIFTPSSYTEDYPKTDILSAEAVQVVTKIEKQSVTDYKKQSFSYYGAVSNLDGLGFLGFRATLRTNWYSNPAEMISSIAVNDINLRGANVANYTVLEPILPNYTPTTFITKSLLTYESVLLPNKVFKIKNTIAQSYNGLDGTSSETVTGYDTYNNPITATATTKEGTTVVQTTTTSLAYDNNPITFGYYIGRPTSKTTSVTVAEDAMTSEELYSYNSNKLLSQIKKKGNNTDYITETNDYDPFGNIITKTISATGIADRITRYQYDPSGRFLTQSTDIEGLPTIFAYNANNGLLNSETNPYGYGLTTSYLYDSWFKKTKTTDYLGKTNNYAYTRIAEKSKITTTGDDGSYSQEVFDDLGRKITSTVKNISGNLSSISYLYDIYDRNYKISEPYFANPTQWSETQYDEYGRPKQNIDFTGKTTTISYSGLTTTINDGSKTKTSVKNAIGNVVSMTDTPGGTINYTYFANGNLKTTNYNGVITTITQDGWGRKTQLVDPSAGTYTYAYNSLGETTSETTPNGTTAYTLNAVGKLIVKTIVGTNTNSSTVYNYDSTSKSLVSSIFTNVLEGNATTENNYFYDGYKRLIGTTEVTPYATFDKHFFFDDFGRVEVEITSGAANGKNSSKTIKNTYKNGYHWQILDNNTQQVLWQTNTINARGQLLTAQLGNGIAITNTYDQYGFASQFKHDKTGANPANIMTLNTAFDPQKGNLSSRTNSMFNWNESFTYDNLDRLTSYPNALGVTESQDYEDDGRIKTNTLGTYNYANTAKKYQNTSVTLTPEAKTYYQTKPLQTVSYNSFKSPVEITEQGGTDRISFTYNDNNSRSAMFYGSLNADKTLRPLRKYYSADGSMEIKQNILTGATEFVTYLGGDGYSAPIVVKSDGLTQNYLYLHRDYQGSILAITDANAVVLEKRLFDAWGSLIKLEQNGVLTPLPLGGAGGGLLLDRGYTGHEHLLSVGLIHMNGRLYDPKLHRFLQPDNFVQDASNTQNYNRYGYVLNNPLKYTDPSGESFWKSIGKWVKKNLSDIVAGVAIVVGVALLIASEGVLSPWSASLIGSGLAHFGATYAEYTKTGDWNAASNHAGFNFSYTAETDWGYDSKPTGVTQEEPVVKPIAADDVRNMSSGGGNVSPAQEAIIKARNSNSFYGANVQFNAYQSGGTVYNMTYFGTIHTSHGFYNDYLINGLDSDGGSILMHEYGHYLHAQYSPLNFYSYAFWSSGATANFSWANTNWTEIRANTMSYYYFGQPNYWRQNEYPTNSNYLSKQEIFQLTHHLPPFNRFKP